MQLHLRMSQTVMVLCIALVGAVDIPRNNRNDDIDRPLGQLFTHTIGTQKVLTQNGLRQGRKFESKLNTHDPLDIHHRENTNERPDESDRILHSESELQDRESIQLPQNVPYDRSSKLVRTRQNDMVGSREYISIPNVPLSKKALLSRHRHMRDPSLTTFQLITEDNKFEEPKLRRFVDKTDIFPRQDRLNETISRRQTGPMDYLTSALSPFPSSVSDQNRTNEGKVDWRKKNKVWLDMASMRQLIIRDHGMSKRAARLAEGPLSLTAVKIQGSVCDPCYSFRNYCRFHDEKCVINKSPCLWCECPNKISCDPGIGTMAICNPDQCSYGWQGLNCSLTFCPIGYFAPFNNCSLQCEDTSLPPKLCHPITGESAPDRLRPVCPRHRFGESCQERCHCWGNRVCNPITGTCPEHICVKNSLGLDCDTSVPPFSSRVSVRVMLVAVLTTINFTLMRRITKPQMKTRCEDDP